MPTSFDISTLRDVLGDDRETEAMLLEVFVMSVEETLASLRPVTTPDWASSMHKIKGAGLNIGAEQLSTLAKRAELEAATLSVQDKEALLTVLEAEFAAIKTYIAGLGTA